MKGYNVHGFYLNLLTLPMFRLHQPGGHQIALPNCRKTGKYRPTAYHTNYVNEADERQGVSLVSDLDYWIDGGPFTDTQNTGRGCWPQRKQRSPAARW